MPRYYDIDTILAEEELLTVKPKFSFAHLSHLDPDSHRAAQGRKRRREVDGTIKKGGIHHHLPEGTKIQMPLWLVDRWAMLNFVRVPAPPKHYRQGMKERLEADAVHMNLCSNTDHYFLAGTLLVNLLLRAAHVHRQNNPPSSSARATSAADAESLAMERLALDARSLQRSLLSAIMGERLCRNFDWTLSALDAMEDDVSGWVSRLSTLERRMFGRGLDASGAVKAWREYGCGRLGVSLAALKGRSGGMGGGATAPAAGGTTPAGESSSGRGRKRRVVTPVMGGGSS